MNKYLLSEYFTKYLKEKKKITLISLSLQEQEGSSVISIKLKEDGKEVKTKKAEGVGLVDAGFRSLLDFYSKKYKSLNTIDLTDLYFQVDHGADRDLNFKSKTDIKIEFKNNSKQRSCFSERTTSMGFTAVSVLVKAFEFYINCELLFKRMKFLIEDAQKRSRQDIVSEYRYVLSQVVEVTSYQEVA